MSYSPANECFFIMPEFYIHLNKAENKPLDLHIHTNGFSHNYEDAPHKYQVTNFSKYRVATMSVVLMGSFTLVGELPTHIIGLASMYASVLRNNKIEGKFFWRFETSRHWKYCKFSTSMLLCYFRNFGTFSQIVTKACSRDFIGSTTNKCVCTLNGLQGYSVASHKFLTNCFLSINIRYHTLVFILF